MENIVLHPKAGRRQWLGLAILALPCVLYAMDGTVLDLAVPRIVAELAPSSSELLWILDIYGFVLAGSLITMGTLGDRIGRRRLLLAGAAAFGGISVLAAFSTSARMLIAMRALQGLAGATLAPSTLSLLHAMFVDKRQRAFAIGIWGASFSVGGALGPVLGGVLLEHFWWGSVFLLALPVMVLLLAAGPKVLPEVKDPHAGSIDLRSAALSLATILLAIFGVKEVARGGSWWLAGMPASALLGVAFVRRQRSLADPLIDLRMFTRRSFSAALATNAIAVSVVFGCYMLITQHLQLALGMSPLRAGTWMLPSMAGFTVGSMVAPLIARRVRPALVIAGGLVLASGGFLAMSQYPGIEGIVLGSISFSLGLAPVLALGTGIIVGSAPAERAGAASGIAETSSELGGALGIALFGSFATVIYRSHLGADVPAGSDTLAGAVAIAAKLPGDRAARLLATSRHAFQHAFELSASAGAAVLLATAVLVVAVARAERATSGRAERDPHPALTPT
jgi:DHA2 family multidrug resistance protein-like MFS transporter